MEAGSSDPADPAGLKSRPPSDLEWCDRRLLARIHRLTLGRLRREIAPVTSADFMRWLLTWQHVAPGSQAAADEHGVLEVVHQLQGFEAPSSAWERHLLRSRIRGYEPELLDGLCLAGTLGWGRLSPHPATLEANAGGPRRVIPTSAAPITFFVREDADWMPVPGRASGDPAEKHHLSPPARDVLHVLHRAGASFFADIVRGSRRLRSEVEAALWELVAAGLVTADGFDNLRALIDPRRRAGQGSSRDARPRHSTGRWTLLSGHFELPAEGHQMEAGSSDPVRGRASAACQMLLRRYGIVFRELLSRESLLPPWRELLIAFRRMEDRGELRGGRFVSGFIGEQFALATAVESLRAQRHRAPTGDVVTVAAADPLNLVGVILPGERVAANSGKLVSFKDGVPVETEDRVVRSVAG